MPRQSTSDIPRAGGFSTSRVPASPPPPAAAAVRGLSHAAQRQRVAAAGREHADGGNLTSQADPASPGTQRPAGGAQRAVIAVDAMGGDHAPAEIVAGAVRAFRDSGVSVILTGRSGPLRPLLAGHHALAEIPIVTADDSLSMAEGALASWRRPRSSIAVACQLVRRGQAAAVVSAGSTG